MKTVERWEHRMLTAYVVVSNGEIVCLYLVHFNRQEDEA